MPPPAIKTIKDLLFWQYAKIIAESAGYGKKKYGFIMNRFKKLKIGEIQWSTSIREYIKEREVHDKCIYCGSEEKEKLTKEHILPKSRQGPEEFSNIVFVCKKCNSSKGDKRLYEWFGLKNRNRISRIAEGKYLKLLYELHNSLGTLHMTAPELCPICDLEKKCPIQEKLTVYCLEGLFQKK